MKLLDLVLNTFGSVVFVPLVLFIVAKALSVKTKKAFQVAVLAAVGLTGFGMIIGGYMPVIIPVISQMVDVTGVELPVFDAGWQNASIIAYSTRIGMLFIGIALGFQILLFFIKWTNVFMPSDLWNNYSFMVWGSMLYLITGNMPLAIGLMIVQNLYILLFSEVFARRWSKYYKYPNCTMSAPHHIGGVPFIIGINWFLNKLGLYKIKIDADSLQSKLGFIGDPMTLGLLLGFIIGILGNINNLGSLSSWGQITGLSTATAAVMGIFPKVAGIFASAFTPLTDASTKSMQKGNDREWYLAVNDAAAYGESNTLITGIMLIPIIFVIALILPGNKTLPVVDLIALPFMISVMISASNGNIFKGIIGGVIYFAIGLGFCTYTAGPFTEVASSVGIGADLIAAGLMITSFGILNNPTMGLLFMTFLTGNPLFIGIAIALYFILHFAFRKYKEGVYSFIEVQAMMEETIETSGV